MTRYVLLLILVAGCGKATTEEFKIGEFVWRGSQPYCITSFEAGDDDNPRYAGKDCAWCLETFGALGYPGNCHQTLIALEDLQHGDDAKAAFEKKAGGPICEVKPPKPKDTKYSKAKWPSDESLKRAYADYYACLALSGEDPFSMVLGEIYFAYGGEWTDANTFRSKSMPLTVYKRAVDLESALPTEAPAP